MAHPRTRRSLYLVLGALTAFGPLSTDLYLPGLPDMARVLGTSPSLAQATMATCLVGLALGQLVAGPLSDRLGRRRPLLAGVALFVLTSALCALATSVWLLLALRFVQGLAGGAGIVIARAVVRDLFEGRRAAQVFSQLMLVFGLAPVVAPVVGGQILRFADWRGLFVALAVIGALILLGSRAALPETLPPAARHTTGSRAQLRQLGGLVTDRTFAGHMAVSGLHGATLFAYISMSSFVLQEEYGLGPQGFSLVFAANAVGLVLGAQLNGALVMRLGPARLLVVALAAIVTAAAALVAGALTGHLAALLVPLFLVITCVGGIGANNTALALGPHASSAGSAAALLGMTSFGVGAVLPPVASLLGTTGTVMAATMLTTSALSLALVLTVVRPWRRPEPAAVPEAVLSPATP
ncbi:multidrug effflux MFS transporter [Geodermatophilus sp. CPCC 205506]|uniref:multidrug effflux MFS transporter n=1 Tax=Geodermatophilus sp. CPCC 205506 TaxID=2936596 RepID=UPI003EE8BFFB